MSYATFEEVVLRYPIVSTWAVSSDDIKSNLLIYSDIELNSALSPEFTVPFSDTPPIIRDLSIDMSYLKLLMRQDIEKAVCFKEFLYNRIKQIKAGEVGIVTDSGTVIEATKGFTFGIWSTTMDYNPTESMLPEYSPYTMVDSNYIEHLEDIRS